jgi:hypothetical protein
MPRGRTAREGKRKNNRCIRRCYVVIVTSCFHVCLSARPLSSCIPFTLNHHTLRTLHSILVLAVCVCAVLYIVLDNVMVSFEIA